MLEGLKKWWKEATSSHPAGTGRIGFVSWSAEYRQSPWSRVDKREGFAKALELERLGRKSKMLILDGMAAGHSEWVPTDLVDWVDSDPESARAVDTARAPGRECPMR